MNLLLNDVNLKFGCGRFISTVPYAMLFAMLWRTVRFDISK